MKYALKTFLPVCLFLALVSGLRVFGQETVSGAEVSTTGLTLTVLGDIKDTLQLGFSHEYEGVPMIAGTPDSTWNFGTIIPEEGAYTTSGFSHAVPCIQGYGWVVGYQSNSYTKYLLEQEQAGDSDISALQLFYWQREWIGLGFSDYYQPGLKGADSTPIPPTYGSVETFPWGMKIDMSDPEVCQEISPWSLEAGDYKIKVISKWFPLSPDYGVTFEDPVLTAAGYMDLTVANAIDNRLCSGIGTLPGVNPGNNVSAPLEIGQDWTGEIYLWVLNYRANSDFGMETIIYPITLNGETSLIDIRKYMTYSGRDDPIPDITDDSMLPSDGEEFIATDVISMTLATPVDISSRIKLDLSGGSEDIGWNRWKVRAGTYKPTGDTCISFFSIPPSRRDNVYAISISPDDFQVIVPEKQTGYELLGSGEFVPREGIKPGKTGFYEQSLNCYQNHDRNVAISWQWTEGRAGKGEISWRFLQKKNLVESIPEEDQVWKGIFKYNPQGKPSQLQYSVTYEPDWIDEPGEKELIIIMSHSPVI